MDTRPFKIAAFFFLAVFFRLLPAAAEPVMSLSEEELRHLAFPLAEWQQELAGHLEAQQAFQKKSMGPIVSVLVPESVQDKYIAKVPLKLLVLLKKRQAPINIDSLAIEGQRGYFSLDITQKIRVFLREPQNGEDADHVIDAKLPIIGPGHYRINMSIKDILGNIEEISAFLEVIDA